MVDQNLYTPGLQFSFISYYSNFGSMSTTIKHFEVWYYIIQNPFKQLRWYSWQKWFNQLSTIKDFCIKSIRKWLTESRIQLCLTITNKQESLDDMIRQNSGLLVLYHLNLRNVLQIFTVPQATIFCIFIIWTVASFSSKPRSCRYYVRHFGI